MLTFEFFKEVSRDKIINILKGEIKVYQASMRIKYTFSGR